MDLLRFELRPDSGGTVLIFTRTFDDRPAAASYATGWLGCFAALGRLMDGEPPGHVRPSAQLRNAYVEAFGLDAGSAEDLPGGGWKVRFDRQLKRSADDVWAALALTPALVGSALPPRFTTSRRAGAGGIRPSWCGHEESLVRIAPRPMLPRFSRRHDRVPAAPPVLGRVPARRAVTAAHVPAREAAAQVNPARAVADTFFALAG